jgi:hypothetical protein
MAIPLAAAAYAVDRSESAAPSDDEHTVVVTRRPKAEWVLVLDSGDRIAFAETSVVLGRAPGRWVDGVRGLAVPDPTKTLSKVHARIDRVDDIWTITDLGSTNGVLIGEGPDERTLAANETADAAGRIVLGELGLRIERDAD